MIWLRFGVSKLPSIAIVTIGCFVTGCGGASTSVPIVSPAHVDAAHAVIRLHQTQSMAFANGSYQAQVLADAPLAYYQLADSGSTLVDAGPMNVSGTYGPNVVHQAAPITAYGATATRFPGGTTYNPNGFASTPPNVQLQPPEVTVETWVLSTTTNSTSHDLPIAVYGDEASGVRYGLYLHGLGTQFDSILFIEHTTGQSSELRLYGATHLAVGTVYHVVAVSDGTHVTLYINGIVDQVASYAGNIDYTSPPQSGLQIGGDRLNAQYGSAPFAGTIAQVAVYGSALPASRVISHFLSGQLVPMVSELARRSDSIVDSIGVNAHFDDSASIYATQFAAVKNLLIASGIRHIRVGVNLNDPSYAPQMQQLAAGGIRVTYITYLGMTQAQVQSFPMLVYPSLEQYENPNELDESGGPDWVAAGTAFAKSLRSWMKSDPAIAGHPLLAPALAWPSSYQLLGDLSSYVDYGNIHDYLGAYNPGDPYAIYGGVRAVVSAARLTDGLHPMMSTETGYGTTSGIRTVDYRTDLRYMTRLFFEQFNAGIERSYSYELLDEGGPLQFSNFGLLQYDLAPKPAYTGIKSIISALADPGPAFSTSALTYQLSGFIDNVDHLVMQKRNGSFIVALWLEVPSWDPVANQDIIVPSQTVTLTTQNHFSSASQSIMDENGNMAGAALPYNNGQATLSLTDKVTFVTLNP